jgi:lipopolysaccharide export system permease protein
MLFDRALRRELAYTSGAVYLVLLTLLCVTLVIRILGFAAGGRIHPADVFVMIGLAALGYQAVLLVATLFIAVLIVLTRWYRDSEMAVWQSAGLSLTNFIQPVIRFIAPFVIMVAGLSLWAWPWANQQTALLKTRFEQRDDVSMISPGRFRESANGSRVFFVERVNENATKVENVFISSERNGKLGVAVAREGRIETHLDGDRFLVLEKGRRYEGEAGKQAFNLIEFDHYAVKVDQKPIAKNFVNAPRNLNTIELIHSPDSDRQGELLWRLGLPLLALLMPIVAIPLAYMNPRRGRYTALIFAGLLYLSTSNILSLLQAWVQQKKMSFFIALWPLPIALITLTWILLMIRQSPVSLKSLITSKFMGFKK